MDIFELDGHEYVELHKLLQLVGLAASGGEAKTVVAAGAVTVDGVIELRKRCKVRGGQVVACGGRTIRIEGP